MAKRLRRRKVYPGQLRAYWGKLPHDEPDVIIQWGEGLGKREGAFLFYHFGAQRPRPSRGDESGTYQVNPSFLEALKSRGYDLTTLEFSIYKSPVSEE